MTLKSQIDAFEVEKKANLSNDILDLMDLLFLMLVHLVLHHPQVLLLKLHLPNHGI